MPKIKALDKLSAARPFIRKVGEEKELLSIRRDKEKYVIEFQTEHNGIRKLKSGPVDHNLVHVISKVLINEQDDRTYIKRVSNIVRGYTTYNEDHRYNYELFIDKNTYQKLVDSTQREVLVAL